MFSAKNCQIKLYDDIVNYSLWKKNLLLIPGLVEQIKGKALQCFYRNFEGI